MDRHNRLSPVERAESQTVQNTKLTKSFQFQGGLGLHKGDRPYQQDQVALIPHHYVPGCLLGIVADGMGGKTGGRTASNQAIQTARQLFASYSPFQDDPDQFLRQIANETHVIVGLTSVTSEEEPHTTFAAFLVLPNGRAHISHCGDSRVYLFDRNSLIYRTKDHSYVQSLIDAGKLTEAEALTHPKSNLITSCLGIYIDQGPVISQYTSPVLTDGSVLVACSDGLWHGVTTEEIGWVVNKCIPKIACEKLVNQAYKRSNGHSDNISIAIVRITDASTPDI
ncbi:MAG: hypothetical protein MESAZ_01424 [Saezia sanguinis]